MNSGINNNFGFFGIPGGGYELSKRNDGACDSPKNQILRYAIKEVSIGTLDSIRLAVDALQNNAIKVPSLILLLEMKNKAVKSDLDEKFHQSELDLQKKAISEIEKFLEE
jgi:hypothetical protein